MNYTKGEWKVEYPNWTMIAVLTMDEEVGYETYKYIAEVNPCEDGRFLDGEETANAHLIAAAPDMYEALEDIIKQAEKSHMMLPPDLADSIKVFGKQALAYL